MLQCRVLYSVACDAPSCIALGPERPGQLMAIAAAARSNWHIGAEHMCPRHAPAYLASLDCPPVPPVSVGAPAPAGGQDQPGPLGWSKSQKT
jgi:hypothetical protein